MQASLYSLRAFKLALVLARILPRGAAQNLASAIAWRVYSRDPECRAVLRGNLCGIIGRNGATLDDLCVRNISNFARMLADYFRCAAGAGATSLLTEWRGLQNVEAARTAGRGVILVTAHLGNWELGGVLLAQHGLPMSVVTLEEPTSALTEWRDAYRRKVGIRTHTVGPGHSFAFVEMVAALRRNEVVAMLADRPYAGSGSPVQFFGRQTEFSTGPALLWQHTGAPVIPAFVLRNDEGRYTAFADAPLPFARTKDSRADIQSNTQILAAHFENVIRQYPDQWFNYVPIWPSQYAV